MSIVGAGSGGDEEHLLLFDESGELVIDLAVYFSHFYSPLLFAFRVRGVPRALCGIRRIRWSIAY